MPAPATRQDVVGQCSFSQGYPAPCEVPLLVLQEERAYGTFARVGDWTIRTQQDVSYDNHKYSKSWHAAHGGAKSVDARIVLIRRVKADGTLESRDQRVDSWRFWEVSNP